MLQQFHVTKASGQKAAFDLMKLQASLKSAGASEDTIKMIVRDVSNHFYEGISTKDIYQFAFQRLKKINHPVAAKYKLKKAIMELGPSGFPFEKYISSVFKKLQFEVQLNQSIQGHCVNHEVDIVAIKKDTFCIIECKYHNLPGTICDVKIPLYIHSRFHDIVQKKTTGNKMNYESWIVTNTKFSADAMQYGTCRGLRLLSWDFPAHGSLKNLVDQFKLYPLTCLTTLSKTEKLLLMEQNMILCEEVLLNKNALPEMGIKAGRVKKIITEAELVCNN